MTATARDVERIRALQRRADALADWPEPQPLADAGEPEPYPVSALPTTIGAAVTEVQAFTRAPLPLVAGSALAAVSLSAQALADVRRAEGLQGPVGLFLLTVADSGERKSATDRLFTAPVAAWERQQVEFLRPALVEYAAKRASWEARRDGLLAAIRDATKKNKATGSLEGQLADLETIAPTAPRVPRLVRVDATPEALAWAVAREWPSAAVLSAEAGSVLGGHAMSRETQMRALALMNVLWDGGTMHVARRTSDNYTVRGARLTMHLQAQPAAISAFAAKGEGLARGMGFLARFLAAWPVSTQGSRMYRDPPASWPALSTFTDRVIDLLNQSVPLDDDGALAPPVLDLSPAAKALWVRFHDDVEVELTDSGELAEVRDVAAKAADNCARLAALFHLLDHGVAGSISAANMEAAAQLVAWYLVDARRFFRGVAVSPAQAQAVRLDAWLVARARQQGSISTREAQRLGPIRAADAFADVLDELEDAGRIRVVTDGKRRLIEVNPALMGGA